MEINVTETVLTHIPLPFIPSLFARLQLSDTLLQILFPASPSGSGSLEQRDRFRDLTSKQSELVTEIIGHHKVCQRVQDELDSVRKDCVGKFGVVCYSMARQKMGHSI